MSKCLEFPRLAKPVSAGAAALSSVPAGDRVWLVLAVRCPAEAARTLAAEGVEPGARIQILHHEGRGVAVLRVRCRILLLGRRFLAHVEVIPLPEPSRGLGRLLPLAPSDA